MKYLTLFILFCFLAVLISTRLTAQIDPGKNFDLQGFIDKELLKGKNEIVIPPGRYRVKPKGNTHLLFENLNDITIVANNVELICTETVQAINIINCKNLKIHGLAVDYDPLPFTQGRIVAMSDDKSQLRVDILDGYTTNLRNDKLEIYSSETGELVTRTYYSVTYDVDEAKRSVVFTKKPQENKQDSFEEIGDIIVFDTYNKRFSPHSILMRDSEGLVLDGITVYAGTTFAFFEMGCNGSKYINCKVDRRPLETDIKVREVKRLRSNNADGFHSKSAEIGPSYRNCLARYNGDDGFAISGQYHIITATDENIITVVGKSGIAPDIRVGDPVELVSYEGSRLDDANVLSIKKGRELNGEEKKFLGAQKFLAESIKTREATNVYLIEIDRSISLPMGSVIASANRLGNGFEIMDCIAGPNRSRGIIVKASDGIIANNQLIGNWGMGIKCSPEHQWLEAGSGNNLIITNNIVKYCRDVGVAVYAYGGNGQVGPPGAHNNISIIGNTVSESINPAFGITSTIGLKFLDNKVISPDNSNLLPWRRDFGRDKDSSRSVYLENTEKIEENFGLKIIKDEE